MLGEPNAVLLGNELARVECKYFVHLSLGVRLDLERLEFEEDFGVEYLWGLEGRLGLG